MCVVQVDIQPNAGPTSPITMSLRREKQLHPSLPPRLESSKACRHQNPTQLLYICSNIHPVRRPWRYPAQRLAKRRRQRRIHVERNSSALPSNQDPRAPKLSTIKINSIVVYLLIVHGDIQRKCSAKRRQQKTNPGREKQLFPKIQKAPEVVVHP